nr:MAG: hypothetical protein 2 [Guangxi cystovirus 6]
MTRIVSGNVGFGCHVVMTAKDAEIIGGCCVGLKTTVVLRDQSTGLVHGRCDIAGTRRGPQQHVDIYDRSLFRSYLTAFAPPNTKVELRAGGGCGGVNCNLNYRLGVRYDGK